MNRLVLLRSLITPVASIGTDKAGLYTTYFNGIGYLFGKLSFDR